MGRQTWLADVLRSAGLTVHEVSGWKTRGSSTFGPIRGITCHATAGRGSDDAELGVLINGRPGLSGPISQLYVNRGGEWWVIAAGRANHNLVGWAGPNKGYGNTNLLGIEAANDNRKEQWPAVQYRSYVRGVAALAKHLGISVSHVAGHKEHQPAPAPPGQHSTKTDPTFSMSKFRADVTSALKGDTDVIEDSEHGQAMMWRLDALAKGLDTVAGGPRKGEQMWIVRALKNVEKIGKASAGRTKGLLDMTDVPANWSVHWDDAKPADDPAQPYDKNNLATAVNGLTAAAEQDAIRDAEIKTLVEQWQNGGATADEVLQQIVQKLSATS